MEVSDFLFLVVKRKGGGREKGGTYIPRRRKRSGSPRMGRPGSLGIPSFSLLDLTFKQSQTFDKKKYIEVFAISMKSLPNIASQPQWGKSKKKISEMLL